MSAEVVAATITAIVGAISAGTVAVIARRRDRHPLRKLERLATIRATLRDDAPGVRTLDRLILRLTRDVEYLELRDPNTRTTVRFSLICLAVGVCFIIASAIVGAFAIGPYGFGEVIAYQSLWWFGSSLGIWGVRLLDVTHNQDARLRYGRARMKAISEAHKLEKLRQAAGLKTRRRAQEKSRERRAYKRQMASRLCAPKQDAGGVGSGVP